MKKACSLILSCIVFTVAHAQTVGTTALETAQLARQVKRAVAAGNNLCIPWLETVGNTGLYPFQITRALNKRAQESYRGALFLSWIAQRKKQSICGFPISNIRTDPSSSQAVLCPTVDFPMTKKQMEKWLTSHNNFLYERELKRLKKEVWPRLERNLPALKATAENLVQPKNPLQWIAQHLDPKIENLFIGELHNLPQIQDTMVLLLRELRQAQPYREIIVLNEFIPSGLQWNIKNVQTELSAEELNAFNSILNPTYYKVWEEAVKLNMSVLGLEVPEAMWKGSHAQASLNNNGHRYSKEINFWRTLEGIRQRNQSFRNTIRQVRQQHPQALLVIYTGAAHSQYTAPYSLANKMGKEKSFVLELYPYTLPSIELHGGECYIGDIDVEEKKEITNSLVSFPQSFVYFEDPELARTVGYDARLKIHVNWQKHLNQK